MPASGISEVHVTLVSPLSARLRCRRNLHFVAGNKPARRFDWLPRGVLATYFFASDDSVPWMTLSLLSPTPWSEDFLGNSSWPVRSAKEEQNQISRALMVYQSNLESQRGYSVMMLWQTFSVACPCHLAQR